MSTLIVDILSREARKGKLFIRISMSLFFLETTKFEKLTSQLFQFK